MSMDMRRLCFSYLLFVGLVVFAGLSVYKQWLPSIISHIQPYIGGVFQATVQSTSGPQYVASLIFIIMCGSFFSRHVNRFFGFQRLVRTFVISPTTITAASFVLSGIDQISTKPQVQVLVLLTFSTASFLRFSGTDDYDAEFSMRRRLSSRLIEYLLYYLLRTQSTICRIKVLIPLAFLVSACRSNEVFRIWQLRQQSLSNFHDHEIAWERMRKFYEMAMAPLLDSAGTTIENWPGSIHTPTQSYPAEDNVDALQLTHIPVGTNNKDRFDEIKEVILAEGMYGRRWKPNNQYGFLWADGSGVAMTSAMTVVAQAIVISIQRVDLHPVELGGTSNRAAVIIGDILLCSISIGLFLYLLIQSIPGCLVVLNMVTHNSWNQDASMNDWRKWFEQIYGFCRELLEQGHPGPDHASEKSRVKAEDSRWQLVIRGAEGLELFPYVILYAVIRASALAAFLSFSYTLNVGPLTPTERILNRMSLIFAKVTAWDAIRAKSAIISAEVLLNTRMVINVTNISCSTSTNIINTPVTTSRNATFEYIKPLALKTLIDDLDIVLEGDPNKSSAIIKPLCTTADKIEDGDIRRQAINQGLFSSILEELDSIKNKINNINNTKANIICNQYAKPILDLLSQIYFNREVASATTTREQYDKNAKEVVKMLTEFAVQSRWDKVKDDWTQNGIMNELDMQIMRIQLKLSILLFNFDEPSVVVPSISGRILNEWFEARKRHVKGVGFCDFIKDIQDP